MEEKEKEEIKKLIDQEIEKNKPQPPEPTKIEVKPVEATKSAVKKTETYSQTFKTFFNTCWAGICKYITYLMVAFYILLAGIIVYFMFFNLVSYPTLSGFWITLIIIAEVLAFGLSIFSAMAKVSFIFWLLLNIPLIILLIVLAIYYFPLVILALIFLITTVRIRNNTN